MLSASAAMSPASQAMAAEPRRGHRHTLDGALRFNGSAVHEATIFKLRVFTASLYLEHPSSDPGQILESTSTKLLELRFERDIRGEELAQALRRGVSSADGEGSSAAVGQVLRWSERLGDVERGDTLSILVRPGHLVELRRNGALLGQSRSKALCRLLLSSWIGPNPVSESVKRGLLGA